MLRVAIGEVVIQNKDLECLAIAWNWRYEFNGRKEREPKSTFHSMYVCVNCTAT